MKSTEIICTIFIYIPAAVFVLSNCSGACLFIMLMGSPPYKPEDAGMAKLHANMMMGRMSRMKDSLSISESVHACIQTN